MTATAAPEQAVTAAALPMRFVALAIDAGIYFIAVNLVLRLTGDGLLVLAAETDAPLFTLAWAMVYEWGFLVLWSATPGKRLLSMYVAGEDGRGVRPLNAALRVAAFHLFFAGFFFADDIGLRTMGWIFLLVVLTSVAMVATDPQRRALHDRIAGTRVLRGRAPKQDAPFASAGI
jgi:uncharacterized RDD family membrane protein YckC